MKIDIFRILEGTNLKGKSKLLYIKFINTEKKKISKLINDYEYICKYIGINGVLNEVNYDIDGGEVLITFEYKEVAEFIIESLIEGKKIEEIIKKSINIKNKIWEISLLSKADDMNIPVIKIDENSIQIGYGAKSKIITREQWEKDKKIPMKNDVMIPIISVTGTNGKTSTVRLIHSILLKLGYMSGLSSTGGVFIGENLKTKGDTTGFYSARMVLKDKKIDVAVLETARGGIIKKGLGYQSSKVGVITSLSSDHLDMDGITTLEDLVKVKNLISEEIVSDGKLIINANSHLVKNIKTKVDLVLFHNYRNEYIDKFMKMGKEVWYVENNMIIYSNKNKKIKLININDIPYTHYGISSGNIKNLLAALSAIYTIHPNIDEICHIVRNIHCDLRNNPGRQNIFDIYGYKIILDYGHNEEAFREVFTLGEKLKENRMTGIISAPGDRKNKFIENLGKIASEFCDEIIIKETFDRRGRSPLEISKLLEKGAKEGKNKPLVKLIMDECEAVINAMKRAQKGDVIVVFTQHIDVLIPAMNKYLDNVGIVKIDYKPN